MAVIGLSTFKIHSHILDMRNMMGLTREEKEDLSQIYIIIKGRLMAK